jgi:hypothetical protein
MLVNLYKNEKDEILKEMIAQFFNKSKEEILSSLLTPKTTTQTSYPVE